MGAHSDLDRGIFLKNVLDQASCSEMIKHNVWHKHCPVSLDRLLMLNLSYVNYEGKCCHDGKMVVFDVIADNVLLIFQELYIRKFPINSIKLMNDFLGNDNKSMEANNTSAFNGRKIANSTKWSVHSYGMAIDINPEQNPCLDTEYKEGKKEIEVLPPKGMSFINRTNIREGMVESIIEDSTCFTVVDLFKKHGFIWGGGWNFPIDLHHFQIPTDIAKKLIEKSFDEGKKYFASMLQKK